VEGSLAELGLSEVGAIEVGRAEVGPAQVGPIKDGVAELGVDQLGPAEIRDFLICELPSIPFFDPILSGRQQLDCFIAVHNVEPLSKLGLVTMATSIRTPAIVLRSLTGIAMS
jgi:hypothetical protein